MRSRKRKIQEVHRKLDEQFREFNGEDPQNDLPEGNKTAWILSQIEKNRFTVSKLINVDSDLLSKRNIPQQFSGSTILLNNEALARLQDALNELNVSF